MELKVSSQNRAFPIGQKIYELFLAELKELLLSGEEINLHETQSILIRLTTKVSDALF